MNINFNLFNEYDIFFNKKNNEEYQLQQNDSVATNHNADSQMNIENALKRFEQGTLEVADLLRILQENNVAYTANKTTSNHEVIMFEFAGKKYAIACNGEASKSANDNKSVITYTSENLTKIYKLTEEIINKYFYAVEIVNGEANRYALKPDCGYASAGALRGALYQETQSTLILNNFLSNKTAVNKTSDNKTLSINNFLQYKYEIDAASSVEKDELRQSALAKFVKEFSRGNIAYAQVSILLKAIGVSNTQIKTQKSKYVISFEFNNKKYTVTCNQNAAKSGLDNILDKNGSYLETTFNSDGSSTVTTYNSQGEVLTTKYYGSDGKLIMNPEDRELVDKYKNQLILYRYFNTIGKGELEDLYNSGETFTTIDGQELDDDVLLELIKSGNAPNIQNFNFTEEYKHSIVNKFILDIQEGYFYDLNQFNLVAEALKQVGVENILYKQIYSGGDISYVTLTYNNKNYQVTNNNANDDFDLRYEGEVISREELIKRIQVNPEEAYYYDTCLTIDGQGIQFIRCKEKNDTVLHLLNANGRIDESVAQGASQDCWILAGILALNSTKEGANAIKNAIKINNDGSVTVTFKGVNTSYTISLAEILKNDTDNNLADKYSNGDNDILILELATERLLQDIQNQVIKINAFETTEYERYSADGDIDGGYAQQMIYFLTGALSETLKADDLKVGLSSDNIIETLNSAINDDENAITFNLYGGTHTAKTIDGKEFSVTLELGHSYAIIAYTEKTVTFVDPFDSTKQYTMTLEEFAKLGIGMISVTKADGSQNDKILENDTEHLLAGYNEIMMEIDNLLVVNNPNYRTILNKLNTILPNINTFDDLYEQYPNLSGIIEEQFCILLSKKIVLNNVCNMNITSSGLDNKIKSLGLYYSETYIEYIYSLTYLDIPEELEKYKGSIEYYVRTRLEEYSKSGIVITNSSFEREIKNAIPSILRENNVDIDNDILLQHAINRISLLIGKYIINEESHCALAPEEQGDYFNFDTKTNVVLKQSTQDGDFIDNNYGYRMDLNTSSAMEYLKYANYDYNALNYQAIYMESIKTLIEDIESEYSIDMYHPINNYQYVALLNAHTEAETWLENNYENLYMLSGQNASSGSDFNITPYMNIIGDTDSFLKEVEAIYGKKLIGSFDDYIELLGYVISATEDAVLNRENLIEGLASAIAIQEREYANYYDLTALINQAISDYLDTTDVISINGFLQYCDSLDLISNFRIQENIDIDRKAVLDTLNQLSEELLALTNKYAEDEDNIPEADKARMQELSDKIIEQQIKFDALGAELSQENFNKVFGNSFAAIILSIVDNPEYNSQIIQNLQYGGISKSDLASYQKSEDLAYGERTPWLLKIKGYLKDASNTMDIIKNVNHYSINNDFINTYAKEANNYIKNVSGIIESPLKNSTFLLAKLIDVNLGFVSAAFSFVDGDAESGACTLLTTLSSGTVIGGFISAAVEIKNAIKNYNKDKEKYVEGWISDSTLAGLSKEEKDKLIAKKAKLKLTLSIGTSTLAVIGNALSCGVLSLVSSLTKNVSKVLGTSFNNVLDRVDGACSYLFGTTLRQGLTYIWNKLGLSKLWKASGLQKMSKILGLTKLWNKLFNNPNKQRMEDVKAKIDKILHPKKYKGKVKNENENKTTEGENNSTQDEDDPEPSSNATQNKFETQSTWSEYAEFLNTKHREGAVGFEDDADTAAKYADEDLWGLLHAIIGNLISASCNTSGNFEGFSEMYYIGDHEIAIYASNASKFVTVAVDGETVLQVDFEISEDGGTGLYSYELGHFTSWA